MSMYLAHRFLFEFAQKYDKLAGYVGIKFLLRILPKWEEKSFAEAIDGIIATSKALSPSASMMVYFVQCAQYTRAIWICYDRISKLALAANHYHVCSIKALFKYRIAHVWIDTFQSAAMQVTYKRYILPGILANISLG